MGTPVTCEPIRSLVQGPHLVRVFHLAHMHLYLCSILLWWYTMLHAYRARPVGAEGCGFHLSGRDQHSSRGSLDLSVEK